MSLLNTEGDCVTEKSDDTSISTQLSAIFNRLDAMQESYNGRLDALVDSSEARFTAMERVLAEIGSIRFPSKHPTRILLALRISRKFQSCRIQK